MAAGLKTIIALSFVRFAEELESKSTVLIFLLGSSHWLSPSHSFRRAIP